VLCLHLSPRPFLDRPNLLLPRLFLFSYNFLNPVVLRTSYIVIININNIFLVLGARGSVVG
jgi:hypothetical protein